MPHFPQPESPDGASPAQDPFQNEDLRTMVHGIEHTVTVVEPRVRHFNRQLVDLFGPHPSSPDGSWVFVTEGPEGSFHCGFRPIELRHVFRLESLFDRVGDLLAADDMADGLRGRSTDDLGARVVGDAAALRGVPPIHVRVERRS